MPNKTDQEPKKNCKEKNNAAHRGSPSLALLTAPESYRGTRHRNSQCPAGRPHIRAGEEERSRALSVEADRAGGAGHALVLDALAADGAAEEGAQITHHALAIDTGPRRAKAARARAEDGEAKVVDADASLRDLAAGGGGQAAARLQARSGRSETRLADSSCSCRRSRSIPPGTGWGQCSRRRTLRAMC